MIPEFEDAVADFRKFLKQQGVPDNIVWISPENTICCGFQEWKIFLDECVNEADMVAAYRSAIERRVGIRFCVLCTGGQVSYCYLRVPVDEVDADYKLLANGAVKLSIPREVPVGSVIRKGFQSFWYQLKESMRFRKWKNTAFRL